MFHWLWNGGLQWHTFHGTFKFIHFRMMKKTVKLNGCVVNVNLWQDIRPEQHANLRGQLLHQGEPTSPTSKFFFDRPTCFLKNVHRSHATELHRCHVWPPSLHQTRYPTTISCAFLRLILLCVYCWGSLVCFINWRVWQHSSFGEPAATFTSFLAGGADLRHRMLPVLLFSI